MKRLLVVSPLDVLGSPNSRTHHVVHYLAPYFDETFSISRMNVTSHSAGQKWVSFFRIRTSVITEGTTHWISLSPIFNKRHGLGLHMLGLTNPYNVPAGRMKRLLRRFLSFMGILTDFGLIPSFMITYFIYFKHRADVFIGEGPWETLFGLILRAFRRVSIVVYDDIDYAPGFQPVSVLRQKFLAYIEKIGIKKADIVISVGDQLASLRRQQGGKNVLIIPNGVDIAPFSEAISLRKAGSSRRPTLIYTGFMGAWAGLDILLKASSIALKEIPSLRVILLGHGTHEDISTVYSSIEELKLNGTVEFRGEAAYSELPYNLSEADIGIALSRPVDVRRYAFPLKVVEYMSAGLPVITTEGTEAADLVLKSRSGVTVPFEAGATAKAIVRILTDADEYKKLSDNAVEQSKLYDWKSLMDQFYTEISSREKVKFNGIH